LLKEYSAPVVVLGRAREKRGKSGRSIAKGKLLERFDIHPATVRSYTALGHRRSLSNRCSASPASYATDHQHGNLDRREQHRDGGRRIVETTVEDKTSPVGKFGTFTKSKS
jgi:hypothetical protein